MPRFATEILRNLTRTQGDAIEAWFTQNLPKERPFFYNSVDLRRSHYKLVPIDTNLFPAGFSTLSLSALEMASAQIQRYMQAYFPEVKTIALIPESHTRNLFYLENIYVLQHLLNDSGYPTRIASLELGEHSAELETARNNKILIEQIKRIGDLIYFTNDSAKPDLILVNNDFTTGAPDVLKDIEQPIIPPVGMGWYRRRKHKHFETYDKVARNFAEQFGFDPWLISAVFEKCGNIDFKDQKGMDDVARQVDRILGRVRTKYKEYDISDEPYVFIKADFGTYGMGIMTARDGSELLEINKKGRHSMQSVKGGETNSQVVIQEGIPTIDQSDGHPAEPMLYLIGALPIGCNYRVNAEKDAFSNLNSRGMQFREMGMEDNLCPIQSLIARLAVLASMLECYEPEWDI